MTDRTPPTDGPELTPPVATVPPFDCPPGEEQGPAIEGVDPYCVPADEGVDPYCVPADEGVDPYCVPADEATPGVDLPITLPVEPPGVQPDIHPSPLPLDIPRELAYTGLSLDQGLTLFALAAMLIAVGWLAWKASRRY